MDINLGNTKNINFNSNNVNVLKLDNQYIWTKEFKITGINIDALQLTRESSQYKNANTGLITENDVIYYGDIIKVNLGVTTEDYSILINGNSINAGDTFIVDNDVVIQFHFWYDTGITLEQYTSLTTAQEQNFRLSIEGFISKFYKGAELGVSRYRVTAVPYQSTGAGIDIDVTYSQGQERQIIDKGITGSSKAQIIRCAWSTQNALHYPYITITAQSVLLAGNLGIKVTKLEQYV